MSVSQCAVQGMMFVNSENSFMYLFFLQSFSFQNISKYTSETEKLNYNLGMFFKHECFLAFIRYFAYFLDFDDII